MKLYSENENYKLYHGNMLDMLEVVDENSIDSIITDPPYELNFMNKGWDNAGISFQKETWKQCYKVLKSGGYLLAFGGSRTFHRIACAIEDAGFEIRDTIMWLYGSGFPKSLNIGLAIDKKKGVESEVVGRVKGAGSTGSNNAGNQTFVAKNQYADGTHDIKEAQNEWKGWGTALKPSYEPIIVARKPVENTVVDNVLKYGVGGINIDECRVGNEEISYFPTDLKEAHGNKFGNGAYMPKDKNKEPIIHNGRFPANTILTYDDTDFKEVCGGFPTTKSVYEEPNKNHTFKGNKDAFQYGYKDRIGSGYEDSGSASRYFYCAKASKKDRDDGLDEFEKIIECDRNDECYSANVPFNRSALPKKNIHPTVKPMELMQYLIRLVTPRGGTILDPFNGSGSTGKAVMYENAEKNKEYKYIGIELTEEYLPISKARIESVNYKKIQTSLF